MFNKLKSFFENNPKSKGITWQDGSRPGCGVGGLFCGKTQTYDNTFADITRIAEACAEVLPYAVDSRGKRLKNQPNLVRAIYNPNEMMSGSDFIETLMVMMLVHPIVYILCWHYEDGRLVPGGPISDKNIAGYTFLEGVSVSRVAGTTTYYVGSERWGKEDVMALSMNVNPYSLTRGYSPSQAVQKWATTDDYIAEYQAATFRNGAVPAGEMIITAPSVEAYNDAVDKLQAAHRGSNNANNIIYTHRPTSSIDGKPMSAGVEWVPFAQSNKELSLQSIFDQANKKLSMGFGVPDEIKGYLQNSNYASAEVADLVFRRWVVYPKIKKMYAKLTHEMSRIVGGKLNFSLSFDYELPVLTDTRKIQTDTLKVLIDSGFTVESAIDALQLPPSFRKLVKGQAEEVSENLEAIEDTREKPIQEKKVKPAKSKQIVDGWFKGDPTLLGLLNAYDAWLLDGISSNANNDSIADNIDEMIDSTAGDIMRKLIIARLYYLLAVKNSDAAKIYAAKLGITEVRQLLSQDQIMALSLATQTALAQLDIMPDKDDVTTDIITPEIETAITAVDATLDKYGIDRVIPDIEEATNYHRQLNWLLISFATQTLDRFLDLSQNNDELATVLPLLGAEVNQRANRWVASEQHRAEELGALTAAAQQADELELEPMKTWHINPASPDVCVFCIDMDGQTVPVNQPFSNGDMVPHYHPNCYCTFSVEFVAAQKSVKVCCPECGRYMLESAGGVMKNVICANSKCKKHFDIKVNKGVAKFEERNQ